MSASMVITEAQQPVKSTETKTPPKKWYTRLTKIQWTVAASAALSVTLYTLLHVGRVSTNDAQIEAHIITIAPHVPGYVQDLKIDDNWKVKAGQVLFTIDPRDYQVRLEQTSNAYETALAQERATRVGITLPQNPPPPRTTGPTPPSTPP